MQIDERHHLARRERDLDERLVIPHGIEDDAHPIVAIEYVVLLDGELGKGERQHHTCARRRLRGVGLRVQRDLAERTLGIGELTTAERRACQHDACLDRAITIAGETFASPDGELLGAFEVSVGELDVGQPQQDATLQWRAVELVDEPGSLLEYAAHQRLTSSEDRLALCEIDQRDRERLGVRSGPRLVDTCPQRCEHPAIVPSHARPAGWSSSRSASTSATVCSTYHSIAEWLGPEL